MIRKHQVVSKAGLGKDVFIFPQRQGRLVPKGLMEGGSFQSRICLERLCTIYLRCESTALSLVQDASCGWLCLRYSGSNSSLRRCVGVLGVFPLAELGQVHAYKVAHATRRIIEEFATPTRTMPYSKQGRFLGLFFYVWESFQEGLTV